MPPLPVAVPAPELPIYLVRSRASEVIQTRVTPKQLADQTRHAREYSPRARLSLGQVTFCQRGSLLSLRKA